MKKLMCAAAAIAASVCVADISSSNVVGYGPTATQEDGITVGASFIPVASDGMIDLTDLIVTGYMDQEGFCDGLVNIQTLDQFGRTIATYTWMDDGQGKDAVWYGWYADGAETPIARGIVTIQPGEGLWAYSQRGGLAIQSSGEVPTRTDIIVTLQEDGFSVANPTPVKVDLSDTYITGYMEIEGLCDGLVNVQTLDQFGRTVATYTWMDDGQGESAVWYGWYADGAETPIAKETVTVHPGEGLWAYSQRNGLFFNWPKVEL